MQISREQDRLNTAYKNLYSQNERTSKKVAKKASKILRSSRSSAAAKSVAGSALTQAANRKK
ncbi:MAG TPA: hypothetical protein VK324_09395 [Tepidisphaeraceae bacterium]|nr:hypothetical protein [Tepidisphaeraceae bacterium]